MTYSLTPVGAEGLEEQRTEQIPGPLKCDPLTVAGLHIQIGQLRQRVEDETNLRLTLHRRLDHCARVFAVLSHVYPELRGLIARARKDIWNG